MSWSDTAEQQDTCFIGWSIIDGVDDVESKANVRTLLYAGVQLGDLDSQAVDTVLEGVRTNVKGVGLIKKFPEDIFGMFTCNQSKKPEIQKKGAVQEQYGLKMTL